MSPAARRELALAVLLCLLGAFVVLVAAGRTWAQVAVAGTGLLPERTVQVRGSDLQAGLQALGLVGLAGVVALAATRSWGRTVVGALLLLLGLGVLALSVGAAGDLTAAALDSRPVRSAAAVDGAVSSTVWPYASAGGGLLLSLAGLLVAVRGSRWSGLGRRYEAPVAAVPAPAEQTAPTERSLWEALDRGEDPTTG